MTETGQATGTAIEVRVESVAQMFDTLDPFPFPERDLDKEAEEFIVGWARELPRASPIAIRVHLPAAEAGTKDAVALPGAMGRYFAYRAEGVARELRELFRVGRGALAIGIVVLVVCLSLSQFLVGQLGDAPFGRVVTESLIIVGWVANWKPIEIFLYDWWPLARRRNLYRRLAAAKVELRAY